MKANSKWRIKITQDKVILCVVFMASIVMFTACGKTSSRTLTSATGSVYECLVVMPNNALTQDERNDINHYSLVDEASGYSEPIATTYDLVSAVMAAPMPCLPQVEPYFKLTQVPPSAFDDMLKPTRNILFVDIDPNRYTQTKAKVSINYWSQPQAVYRVQTPSQSEFVAYWLEHGSEVRDWFVEQEIQRQMRFYRASTNKQARTILDNDMHCDMLIPEDYMVIMDTTLVMWNEKSGIKDYMSDYEVQLLWCCNSKGTIRRDVVVYSYPYTDSQTFTADFLNHRRDDVLGRVITATVEGSHMGTEYRVIPPEMREITVQHGQYAAEVRGLWKMLGGEAMGGPYVSLTRLDQVNGNIITAEAFIYAPGQKKRTALRQSEAILHTLVLPIDTVAP